MPLSPALIERLLTAYPGTIAGIKDSSGDRNSVNGLLERFSARGFAVFPGSEALLLAAMRGGGAGCISAQANVNPAAIGALYRGWQQPDAEAQQAALDALRNLVVKFPVIAALKALVAHFTHDEAWATVRPPLVGLSAEQRAALLAALPPGFAISGL